MKNSPGTYKVIDLLVNNVLIRPTAIKRYDYFITNKNLNDKSMVLLPN